MSEKNELVLGHVDQLVKGIGYGDITLHLKVHAGRVVAVIGNNMQRKEYKEDGAIEALQTFTEAMKDARAKREYGTLVTTFVLHGGKVKEMLIQTNFKKMY